MTPSFAAPLRLSGSLDTELVAWHFDRAKRWFVLCDSLSPAATARASTTPVATDFADGGSDASTYPCQPA